ncbi:MAG: phosphoribosylformylglycinamidine synthase subunit PurS [Thermoplasmata archaeon]
MVKVKIYIEYKEGVEDPEALTVKKSLSLLGFEGINSVKISKVYEMEIEGNKNSARKKAVEICEKLLANPVIHRYEVNVD